MKEYLYENKLRSEKTGKEYLFETSDGVSSKNSFRESELLLADTVEPEIDDDILILYSGYGFLGILGDCAPEGNTVLMESSDSAYQISKHNIELNEIDDVKCRKVSSPGELDGDFDKIIYAPQPYSPIDLVKNRISEAVGLLKDEGELFICSGKKEGLNRYRDWLQEFEGKLGRVNHRDSYQVYRYKKEGDVEPEKKAIGKKFEVEVKGVKASFEAVEGVFSPDKLDEGSRLLIENVEIEKGERIWDVGCGYGTIGIFLKKLYDCNIYLSDDDALSVELAEKNLRRNDIDFYNLENADCLDCYKDKRFDVIVTNPPTHQGKAVTDEIFQESYNRLKEGGRLYLVYNQNMSFENQLREIFEEVNVLEEEDNYIVVEARR
ncbi:MAG: methyltransferase [Candidatus Nanohaloarchaea archaeon]